MKKPIVKFLLTSCLVTIALSSNANEAFKGASVIVRTGVDVPTVNSNDYGISTVDRTFFAGIEAAKQLNDKFSVGIEYNYRGKSDFNINKDQYGAGQNTYSWSVSSNIFMINGYMNLLQDSLVIPFIKLGVGASINKSKEYLINDSTTNKQNSYPGKTKNSFAWQAGVGVNIPFNEKIDTEISYNYTDRGTVETKSYYNNSLGTTTNDSPRKIKLQDHAIIVGIKYKF